ncbi:MAG TPA: NAD(P)H-binding protein [Gaiellaceae bacterium]|nr:NAD(P)H-binding protein [Gaiellaceae bacterium]
MARQRIAVAGATGRVGSHVVDVLDAQGYEVVPIARAAGVDLITGEGLVDALSGVSAIVDAATGPSPDEAGATEFFTTAAHNLQELGAQAGVRRIVVVSIVGIDHFSHGYYAAKQAHERAHLAGPVPVRILRATQFHEFVGELVEWGRDGEVSRVPGMRTQLVAARTVAEKLAQLTAETNGPVTSEIGGPREERLVEAARLLVASRGDQLRIEEGDWPDLIDPAMTESDALLPGPGATLAGPTFEEWLASR